MSLSVPAYQAPSIHLGTHRHNNDPRKHAHPVEPGISTWRDQQGRRRYQATIYDPSNPAAPYPAVPVVGIQQNGTITWHKMDENGHFDENKPGTLRYHGMTAYYEFPEDTSTTGIPLAPFKKDTLYGTQIIDLQQWPEVEAPFTAEENARYHPGHEGPKFTDTFYRPGAQRTLLLPDNFTGDGVLTMPKGWILARQNGFPHLKGNDPSAEEKLNRFFGLPPYDKAPKAAEDKDFEGPRRVASVNPRTGPTLESGQAYFDVLVPHSSGVYYTVRFISQAPSTSADSPR